MAMHHITIWPLLLWALKTLSERWMEPPHLQLKGVNNKPYTGSQREEKTNKSLS